MELQIGDWQLAGTVSTWIEVVAVTVIAAAVLYAGISATLAAARGSAATSHVVFKNRLAHGLLVGLDLLIAADVIRTVTLEPTLQNVAALGLLVIVRTFLAWSLLLEAEGRWPWQRGERSR